MATYEVIQMHDAQDASKLQFPKVPLEALIEDANHLTTSYGIPARMIPVVMSATTPATPPTALGQYWYNTLDKKLYPAKTSGTSLVWDTDTSHAVTPQYGGLWRVKSPTTGDDTLYVKSVGQEGGLALLEDKGYEGPFAVRCKSKDASNNCEVSIRDGMVFTQTNGYQTSTIVTYNLPAGATLYLVGQAGSTPTFTFVTTLPSSYAFRVRIAVNQSGNIWQCQYGDIYTSALT